jgi:hypothetical protein
MKDSHKSVHVSNTLMDASGRWATVINQNRYFRFPMLPYSLLSCRVGRGKRYSILSDTFKEFYLKS